MNVGYPVTNECRILYPHCSLTQGKESAQGAAENITNVAAENITNVAFIIILYVIINIIKHIKWLSKPRDVRGNHTS